jgi:cation diffusion facilitator family transporter
VGELIQTEASEARIRRIVHASWIGIAGNALLAVLKLLFGFLSRSIAVVSDGVDSAMDVLTSGISLVAAKITAKPPDIGHPYGHSRAETIASKTFSFVIFLAGAQLAISTITGIVNRGTPELPGLMAVVVTGVSIVGKTALYYHKLFAGKRTNCSMLIADAKNMRGDVAVSLGVLIGLGFTYWLDLPVIDRIVALLISVWIMYVAFRIFLDTNSELMEGFEDTELYRSVFDAVESVPGAHHPHRARVRAIGALKVVDLDIEVDGDLTVRQAHEIAKQTEEAIRNCVTDVYDVLVHVEPVGNIEESERYGLSRRKLGKE